MQVYVKTIINTIKTRNDDHQRELIKILQLMEVSEEYEGSLFDICVTVWEKINKKPSVRFNAFKLIIKIAKKNPDLANEVVFLAQDQYLDLLSPTAKRSIFKMIKEINL